VKLEYIYGTNVLGAPICTIDTYSVFIYSVYLRARSHGVPSPTHVNKSQHGGKAPTIEPKETTKVCLVSIGSQILIIVCKKFLRLVLQVGS
jgi:hypothetical protein